MEISGDAIERGFLAALFSGLLAAVYGLFTMRDKVQKHELILESIPRMQETMEKMAKDINYMRGRWQERRKDDDDE